MFIQFILVYNNMLS